MDIKKTYIPKRYRNKKLINTGSRSGSTTVINSGNDISPSAFVDSDTFYSMFEYDAINDAIKAKKEFYSIAGITAYGTGTVGGGGGTGVTVYNGLDSTDISLALSAAMGKQLNDTKLNSSAVSAWALASVKPVYAISEITGLSTALAGKADATHQHTISQITDFAHVHQWSEIENKPTWVALTTAPFTTALETKLNGIAAGAEVNVQSDWNATSGDAFIANKPTVFTPDTHDHYVSDILNFPTSMPASDVYSWAKAATKPTYNFSEISSKPTTLSGYGITDALLASAYTASDVLTKLKTVDGSGSGLDADLLDGFHAGGVSGAYWSKIPVVGADGVMEVGAYIDFHEANTGTSNYDGRLSSAGTAAFWNGNRMWHAANSNLSTIDWTAKNITVATDIITNFNTWTNGNSKSLDKFLKLFDIDSNGNLVVKTNLYSTGEVTAYSSGAGVAGLKLMGDMNANGKNIYNAAFISGYRMQASNAYIGIDNDYIGLFEDINGNVIAAYYDYNQTYIFAGGAATVDASNRMVCDGGFKFGNWTFKQDGSGRLGIYNGTTEVACFNTDGTYVNL